MQGFRLRDLKGSIWEIKCRHGTHVKKWCVTSPFRLLSFKNWKKKESERKTKSDKKPKRVYRNMLVLCHRVELTTQCSFFIQVLHVDYVHTYILVCLCLLNWLSLSLCLFCTRIPSYCMCPWCRQLHFLSLFGSCGMMAESEKVLIYIVWFWLS